MSNTKVNLIRTASLAFAAALVALALLESNHFYRYGHFDRLGLHAEVVVTTSDDLLGVQGTAKIYDATLSNYGILPVAVTICDYTDWAGRHKTMVNYIVERRNRQIPDWQLVPEWDDYGSRLFCRPSFEVTETHLVRRRLWPYQTYRLGGGIPAQMGGFHIGDEGRFTAFLNADNNKKRSISTAPFRVNQEPKGRASNQKCSSQYSSGRIEAVSDYRDRGAGLPRSDHP